jgi:hypothetical protein
MMVMAALDNVVADVVVVAVVSPRDHVVVVPVSVHIDMLVVILRTGKPPGLPWRLERVQGIDTASRSSARSGRSRLRTAFRPPVR